MKIKIKSGDTVIEYEEETVPFKNDSLYKSDMTLSLVKSFADKVLKLIRAVMKKESKMSEWISVDDRLPESSFSWY